MNTVQKWKDLKKKSSGKSIFMISELPLQKLTTLTIWILVADWKSDQRLYSNYEASEKIWKVQAPCLNVDQCEEAYNFLG